MSTEPTSGELTGTVLTGAVLTAVVTGTADPEAPTRPDGTAVAGNGGPGSGFQGAGKRRRPAARLDTARVQRVLDAAEEADAGFGHGLRGMVETWLSGYSSQETIDTYATDLTEWLQALTRLHADPLKVERRTADAHRRALEHAGASDATIRRKMAAVSSFYSRAEEEDWIGRNRVKRATKPARPAGGKTRALTQQQVWKLLEAADDQVQAARAALQQREDTAAAAARHLEAAKAALAEQEAAVAHLDEGARRASPSPEAKRWRKTERAWRGALRKAQAARDRCGGARQSLELAMRDRLLARMLAGFGTRASEVRLLHVDDVDLQLGGGEEPSRTLFLTKGGREHWRAVPTELEGDIREYLEVTGGRTSGPLLISLDGHQLGESEPGRALDRLAAAAGLKKVHPHRLRATWITVALSKGHPVKKVQKAAGHASGGQTIAYQDAEEGLRSDPALTLGLLT